MAFEFDANSARPEDQFDPTTAKPEKPAGALRKLGDLGLSAAKGVIAVPEAAVGLADIATGGRAGKTVEGLGVRFKDAKDVLTGLQSEDLKGKQQQFSEADGVIDKAGVALRNPSLIANSVAESIPLMGAGAVPARALLAAAPRVGAAGAGAIGEGLAGAGSAAEGIRQESTDGLLTGTQAGLAGASGVLTAGFGAVGGKLAQKLGIADVDTALAKGSAEVAAGANPKNFLRRGAEGAVSEGLLEELPQSLSEQALQNIALDKPVGEGMADAAVMGALAGGVMGAGAGIATRNPPQPKPEEDKTGGLTLAGDPTPEVAPVLDPATGGVIQKTYDPRDPNSRPPLAIMPKPEGIDYPEQVKPSARMGIDPAAGPISSAAALAVDSGAHQAELFKQAEQAAIENEAKKPDSKGTTAGTQTKDTAKSAFKSYEEAQSYITEQKQRGTSVQALPLPQKDGSYSMAMKGTADYTIAEFHKKQMDMKAAGVLDGDILTKSGDIFAKKAPAVSQANKAGAGHVVVPVQGGFVIRKQEVSNVSQPTTVSPGAGASVSTGSADGVRGVVSGAGTGVGDGVQPVRPEADNVGAADKLPAGVSDAAVEKNSPVSNRRNQPALDNNAQAATETIANVQNQAPRDTNPSRDPTPYPKRAAGVDKAEATPEAGAKAPDTALPAAGTGAVEAAGLSDQLEDALFKERDATTSAIENDWMKGNGRRRLTNIERSIYDAVTASTLDADSAAQIIETALENDRPDLAQYAASRAMRAAESMDTTPGVPQSSPKYGKIKSDLEASKKQALDAASALQEIVNSKQAPQAADVKAITAKQIPAMTDVELQQAIEHYGPESIVQPATKTVAQPTEKTSDQAPKAEQSKTQPEAGKAAADIQPAASPGVGGKAEAAKPVKPKNLREKIDQARQSRADYFKPGNVVKSYGGHDEVLSYTEGENGNWSVKVHAITYRDGQWVRQGKPQDARQHSTQPDAKQLKAGPIAVLPSQAAKDVVYSEPRADGQPFPNAVPRGIPVEVVENTPPAPAKSEQAATKEANTAAARKQKQADIFTELVGNPDMVGKSQDEIQAAIKDRLGLTNLFPTVLKKMAESVEKELKKRADELAKQKHRDPEVFQAALGQAKQGDNISTVEHEVAYGTGWAHSLAGKTKSTLAGDNLPQMLSGYEAARKWIKTEEGAAWYEGRPVNKLQNTGMDLRRWFDQLKSQMKADESDIKKAWKQIEKATARADLFAPLLPEGVTPGYQIYINEVRSNTTTFKDWLEKSENFYGKTRWSRRYNNDTKSNLDYILEGERYPDSLTPEDRQKYQSDDAYRAQWLRDKANDYIKQVQDFTSLFEGSSSVAEAAERFSDRYLQEDEPATASGKVFYPKLNSVGEAHARSKVWAGRSTEFARLRRNSDWTQELVDKEATIALPNRATALTPPKMDRVTRDGKDIRGGKDISPEEAKAKFGFADVGFGKYVLAKQDQDHLNYAADAFTDLAAHFGAPVGSIGFGKKMHFTIGALGHGKYAAHFSPNQPSPIGPVQVINVTNTKGDGTVYHEWVHALDHFLGGDWQSRVRPLLLRYLTTKPETIEAVEKRALDFLVGGWFFKGDKKMGKVETAIRALGSNTAMRYGETAYKGNADLLGKDYWGNDQELIARAGEAWAADTLGFTNTYLVNEKWVGDGNVTKAKGYRGTPYPTGEERQLFNKLYTALAKSITWADGVPSIAFDTFRSNMPEEIKAGEKRRKDLLVKENMQQFYDSEMAKRAEVAAMVAEEKERRAQAEQDELDRLAAEKIKDIPIVDAPTQTGGPLSDDDLSALFDEAAAELAESKQEKPATPPVAKPEPTPAPTRAEPKAEQAEPVSPSAAALIAEAAKLGVKGANEALSGLAKLFGGGAGRLNSFGGGFDEETYQKAKPHFQAALKSFQDAGKTLKDLFKMLIEQFGEGIKEYAIRFSKEEALGVQLGSNESASMGLAKAVENMLDKGLAFDWRALFEEADKHFGGTQGEGKYTPKDAYDAMEAGVNRYLMSQNGRAFNPNVERDAALMTVSALQRVTALLPTQTKRTAEQDEFQQFSTVPPFAYVANWVANITSADTMLEPSAGIGGLAVFAKNAGAKVVLNELSSRRAALLQEVFPSAQVFHENAEQINNILPDDVQPTVVVMNPPFSNSAATGIIKKTSVGARHVEQALERLVDGGRLVGIVGDGMAMDKPTFKDWWAKISKQYDVRAVVPVDGKGYAKYGTTFDNVLIVIDKVAPQGREIVKTPVTNYTELIGLLAEVRNDRPAAKQPANDRPGIERDSAESERESLDGVPAGTPVDSGPVADVGDGPPRSGSGLGGSGGRGSQSGGGKRPASGVSKPGQPDAGVSDNAAGSGPGNPGMGGGLDPTGDATGVSITSGEVKAGKLTDSVFEGYTPQRLEVKGAKPHPGPLVQSSAMASVLPPTATYTPNLPKETITKGLLSIAQIESVVYAGQAHQEMLHRDEKGIEYRRGFFIGDGTGVGKGREIAGILLDNLRQGRKKAVWVSEKQGLLNDAKRDFKGIGGDESIIFNQNKTEAEGAVDTKEGVIFTTYSTLRSGAQAQGTGQPATQAQYNKAYPNGTPVVAVNGKTFKITAIAAKDQKIELAHDDGSYAGIARFSQIQSIAGRTDFTDGDSVRAAGKEDKAKKTGQSRLDQLVKWLGEDFDGVIAFDEAHNAGNAVPIKGERGASDPSAQAVAVVELQKRLPKARVVYVSATGATEVSNLSFATRLGLWGIGTPFPTVHNFIAEMEAGGLATMELVARDMKQMGSYLARSLSFDGVTYSRLEHELTPIQQDIYNRMADAWQVTLQNMTEALKVTGAAGEDGEKKKNDAKKNMKSAYWGAQQRFFNQIITSMQMPTVLESIERDIAAGEAVVLQLVNTNEAQQERAMEKRKEDGESTDLEDLDLTPRDQLLQMVEKSFPTQQYEDYVDSDGKKGSRPVLDSNGSPVENRTAVAMRDKLLADLKAIKVPDGPLEMLLNQFGPEITAEVTGRKQRIVKKPDKDGNITAQVEKRGSSAARADADAFMADKKQILIFSDAGGTGFSFQADLTKANQRKRKHYLLQPGWRANKAVQGLGRTHRTNQKSAPHYTLASTNIPAHKRFLSSIARRLDQLGALTKGQRDTSSSGLFSEKDNLESKYATQAAKQLIQDIQAGQVPDLPFNDFLRQMGLEDIVGDNGQIADAKFPPTRQFLNRLLSLTLPMQDKVFNAFIARMEEKVEVAAQRGELDTGMQTIRALETKILQEEVVYTDPRTKAETIYIELEATQPNRFYSLPSEKTQGAIEWVRNAKSGRVWAKIKSGTITTRSGNVVDRYRMMGTSGTQVKEASDFRENAYVTITEDQARDLWDAESAIRPQTYTEKINLISGAMLPIWDRLKTDGTIQIARTQTSDGRRLLGRLIAPKDLASVRKRLNLQSPASKMTPAQVMSEVLKGKIAELSNGWKLERVKVSDDLRIEIKGGYLSGAVARELLSYGVMQERISWADRFFVPTGKDGIPVLESIFQAKPIVDLIDPKAAAPADGETPAMSRSFSPAARSQATDVVERQVARIKSKWKNAPKIIVAFDMADERIPAAVRAEDQRQRSGGAAGTPEGFYYGGTVYLMSSQLKSPGDVQRVLFHETLGHFGLRGTFGDGLKPILQQIATFRKAEVDAKIKEYGLRSVPDLDREIAAEEVLAEMAQNTPEIGFVKRAIAMIRTWLRENGFSNLALTDDEIITQLILPARAFVEQGGKPDRESGIRFSRGTNDPVTNQKDVVGNQGGRSADDTTPGVLFTDENDNAIVYEREGFRISVNRPGAASYVVLWAKQEVNGKTYWRKAGALDTNQKTKKVGGVVGEYLGVSSIEIEKAYRAQGLGLEMYRALMANAAPNIAGVISHTPNRVNKQQVPSIYRKLGAFTDGDNQIIPIGRNESTAPDSDGAPMFSRSTDKLNETLKNITVTDIKARTGNKLADYRGLGLQFLGGRQIVDLYGKDIPQLNGYTQMVQQMSADANEVGAQADKIATGWANLKDERQLAELMHDATLAQIDPAKPLVEGDNPLAYGKLNALFKALSDDAKKVYREARDAYEEHYAQVRDAIRDKIERSEMSSASKAAMLARMDNEFFDKIKGVYFPLARFGKYVVVTRGPTGVVNVSRAETLNEAQATRELMRKAYPSEKGFTVGKVIKDKEFNASRDAVGRGFLKELFGVLDEKGMGEELQDAVNQLYLASMPDLSWAKHGIHRKGTPGFSQDARRAFAQNMFHGARYLAKLRYADQLADKLVGMQNYVESKAGEEGYDSVKGQQVVDELNKRHDSLMNPKSNPLSTALTSFGFVFHMGLSPASAIVNLSGTAMVAYPIMGAKWGFDKAATALMKAGKEAATHKNDISQALSADEKRAYDAAVKAGTIDVTAAHDLAGIAQGEDAGVMWKLRPVMKWASFLFHHAERFNRQITFVAAYRLARETGANPEAAFEQATKATYDGHFDYAASNRPRVMQGNAAKVLLLFKQYGQNMVYTLTRQAQQAMNAETPEQRRESRKALAGLLVMHAAGAGVLGLPLVGTLLAAASMIGGSDDEPWDAEVALRNMLADAFGQKPAEVLARGLSRLTPWDISGRVGLDKLILPDIQEGLEGQRLGESVMAAALGPVAGIGINVTRGMQEISEGHLGRGIETMMPAAFRAPLKALRYEMEGAKDKTGVMIKDEVGLAGVAGQALGFSPSEVRNATEGRSAIYAADKRLMARRSELMAQYAQALIGKDTEGVAEAMAEIRTFNEKNPNRRINGMQLAISVKNRNRRVNEAADGVYLPKKRRDMVEEGRFAVPQ